MQYDEYMFCIQSNMTNTLVYRPGDKLTTL